MSDQPDPRAAGPEEILTTEDLAHRPSRPPDYEGENRALGALAETMAAAAHTALQKLADLVLELCRADSAGITLLEPKAAGHFRWYAAAGRFASAAGRLIPRGQSPSSVVLDRDAVLLFVHPGPHFHFPASPQPPVSALLAPVHAAGRPVGTVWAMSHTPGRQFDAEDARLLTSLARFAAAAYQLTAGLSAAEAGRAELEQRVAERTEELTAANRSLDRDALLLANVRDAVIVTDLAGLVTYWNEGATRLFGFEAAEMLGRPVAERFPEPTRSEAETWIRRIAAGAAEFAGEWLDYRKDGSRVWIEANTRRITDDGGNPVGIMGVSHDITERKRAEEGLRQSEEGFRLLVQTVRDYAILLMDPAGNVASWNEGAERILGYRADEVLGRPGSLFYTEEDLRAGLFERELKTAVREGQATDENWSVRKDGSRFWASGTTTALRGSAGELRGFAKIFRDLTERKAALDALREKDLRLRAALAAARMGTWHWDVRADRQLLDDSLHRLLGLGPGQSVSSLEQFLQLIHPDDRAAVGAAFRRSVEEAASLDIEFRVVWPDGSLHWLKDKGDVVPGPDGRLLHLTGACVDITDRKEAEAELRRAKAELEQRVAERTAELSQAVRTLLEEVALRTTAEQSLRQRSKQLRELAGEITLAEQRERRRLAGVLHDHLQQTLVAARFHLSVLGKHGDEAARAAAAQVEELLNECLAASRTLTAELSPPALNEGDLVTALEWLARWKEDRHGLAVQLTVGEDIPPVPEDVKVLLFESVRELLFNVVKYADVRSASVDVRRGAGTALRILVMDEGRGFDPDGRLQDSREGGFGLFTIRERLGLLNGAMDIDSAPGEGCRITLTVPLAPAPLRRPAPLPEAPLPEPADATPAPGERVRVLIADDHSVMRHGLAALLGDQPDMEIVGEAADGREAIELARELRPDVVLMDVSMPNVGGIEATRVIRGELPQVRVIGLSMFEEADQAQAMLAAGASAYLNKARPSEDLVAAIRRCASPGGEAIA